MCQACRLRIRVTSAGNLPSPTTPQSRDQHPSSALPAPRRFCRNTTHHRHRDAPPQPPHHARNLTTSPTAYMSMVEKRPHPEGQGPNGDAKRAKASDAIAAARAKAAEIAARVAAKRDAANGVSATPPPAAAAAPAIDVKARMEAMKARMAALKGETAAGKTPTPEPTGPRFATTLGNRRAETPKVDAKPKTATKQKQPQEEELENPYFDPKAAALAKTRGPRVLAFNEHGKYLDQASKLRAQSRLEQIKKKLAIQARRAGLDENSERGFLVQPPPDIEWWDEGIVPEKNYDFIDDPTKVKIDSDDSIITVYVQHPPLLKAPQDQRLVEVKPMYLTTKEQAKLRRMRRAADLKEHQAKIRLGLEPPPPPKVKRGNMMRVMGEQAIADPTAVEMLVEGQIAQRHDDHIAANEERKLTKEQEHAKLAANQEKDAQKGLYMCVFKVNTLAFGKHRFQIDNNAKQHSLTGVTLFNPELNLVVVEGGAYAMNKYKKLMLHRINWQENAPPTETQAEKQASDPQWLRSLDEKGEVKDHSYNKCTLIFEGEIKQRSFRKWGSRVCETAGEARETLGRAKLDSLWALAKSMD
ncbi:PRP3-domain-containing protein [Plenodomus tracheiphilus IPT5]|uniref:PRP3-domain-containing protein n=1 Tax=Plenodomus tracheiphilus IPT5 TaxID=1408161 RepID=A0A6A7BEA8_9PLEO|nr:PRP3-domain-containing protein [Plenodomus tracheiphilus IPT5]